MLSVYIAIIVMGIALTIGLNNILLLVNLAKYSKAYQEAAEVLYAPSFPVQILCTGILIPVIEELLFRGVVFRILRKWLPFLWSALISSLIFGIYHGNLVQFVYASLCGIFLAYVYEKSKSIFAPICAHMTMNIVACTMTEFGLFSWVFHDVWRVLGVTFLCVVVFVVFLSISKKWMLQKC